MSAEILTLFGTGIAAYLLYRHFDNVADEPSEGSPTADGGTPPITDTDVDQVDPDGPATVTEDDPVVEDETPAEEKPSGWDNPYVEPRLDQEIFAMVEKGDYLLIAGPGEDEHSHWLTLAWAGEGSVEWICTRTYGSKFALQSWFYTYSAMPVQAIESSGWCQQGMNRAESAPAEQFVVRDSRTKAAHQF